MSNSSKVVVAEENEKVEDIAKWNEITHHGNIRSKMEWAQSAGTIPNSQRASDWLRDYKNHRRLNKRTTKGQLPADRDVRKWFRPTALSDQVVQEKFDLWTSWQIQTHQSETHRDLAAVLAGAGGEVGNWTHWDFGIPWTTKRAKIWGGGGVWTAALFRAIESIPAIPTNQLTLIIKQAMNPKIKKPWNYHTFHLFTSAWQRTPQLQSAEAEEAAFADRDRREWIGRTRGRKQSRLSGSAGWGQPNTGL